MELGEITWQMVPNTVVNRMLDSSLTHELISCRKIRQRTKAMSNAIKYSGDIKTYKRYVNIKTSLLRKLVDDKETDNDSSFTDDDYNMMYKSEASLAKYLTKMSKKNYDYFLEDEIDTDEDDIMSDTGSSKLAIQASKTKQLDLRRSLRKRDNVASNINVSQRYGEARLEGQDSEKLLLERSERNSIDLEDTVSVNTKMHIADKVEDSCVKKVSAHSNEMACGINLVRKDTEHCNQFVQPHTEANEVSQKFQAAEDSYGIMSDSIEIPVRKRKRKKNQACILDNTNTFTNQNLSDSRNDSSCLNLQVNAQVTSADNNKNGEPCRMPPLIINNFHQPKDSGIEEDTDEEPEEHEGKHYNEMKPKRHKAEERASIIFPDFASDKNLTGINDTLKCDGCKLLNETNPEAAAEFLNKGGDKEIEYPKTMARKHKLQPKVTHMEIVRQKYKIIMCNKCLPANTKSLSPQNFGMQNMCNVVIHGKEEIGENTEDTIPSMTKKRLSQLRRLNLTIDSDSSLSDNEDTKCAAESMRDKLLKRSMEYSNSEFSDSEDINARSKQIILMYAENKLYSDKNLKIGKYKQRGTSSFIEMSLKDFQNEESLKQTSFCSVNNKNRLKAHTKVKHALLAADSVSQEESNSECDESYNFDQEEYAKELDRQYMESTCVQKTPSIVHNENEKTTRSRPRNLQELVEEENLVVDTGSATFTLEDIGEHELFIIDIPSVVFDKQLVGRKIVLTEEKLKLGKRKYKAEYKNVGNVSCVFASEKSRRPYKTVNVKPFASIVAHQRL